MNFASSFFVYHCHYGPNISLKFDKKSSVIWFSNWLLSLPFFFISIRSFFFKSEPDSLTISRAKFDVSDTVIYQPN